MSIYSFFLSLIFSGMCASCQNNMKASGNNCDKAYRQANNNLNAYYRQGDRRKLDTALTIIDENIQACPDYKNRMVNLKIRLMILTKAYASGYRFIDSLEGEKFDKSYKKSFYLKSFRAMELNEQGDSVNRDKLYRDIVDDILPYIKEHPSDNEAVADLFFTKVKVEDKAKVLKEIDFMKHQQGNDSLFYEGLKTAITTGGEATTSAIRVP
jgi:hypothetical protein